MKLLVVVVILVVILILGEFRTTKYLFQQINLQSYLEMDNLIGVFCMKRDLTKVLHSCDSITAHLGS